ncbi:transcription termination factor MTEF1, chloroplastic isoform X2 [Capsicum annuum]|uniref:transcription termination factor MTEF1, chloroplastic isoform X2 n=1 Tax=Capsicum annuum TaxID=4072 RepID=UPI001FB0FE54|nr:transcription termination factor MTEF1, chloroplastic isoform X2 [Capsicum annuum]XP_047255558.1 transcription termination factor MTEF1, chloroplastic isoform X2 [Capsicum annuum]XP_047255559.1 transcription termination factor MTEF1, chloroplastic isoform X2 [Capsicum annuum]XP_047255560.1 transcription termination factor MTEF1, chloroplastic isoform X2 [Capsicum annuum]XP_047255561.1 transcription termination factor MTEF1, chloroplastic isoform X2 [Capsicum annuum]
MLNPPKTPPPFSPITPNSSYSRKFHSSSLTIVEWTHKRDTTTYPVKSHLCGLTRIKYTQTLSIKSSISPKPTKTTIPTTDCGLKFREKLLYLEQLKINPTKALQQNPNLRSAHLETIKSVEICLNSMGIERSAIGRILDMHPKLLTSDPYTDLYPIFDFLLNEVAIPFNDIRRCIIRCPRILVSSVEKQLNPTFQFLKEFGFSGSNSITCQTAVLLVYSVEHTLTPKIDYLVSLGIARNNVVSMILRSPGLLTFSIEKNFKPKVEYLLKEMDRDVGELKKFPQYFSFSLEGKIKPRHKLLVEHGFTMSLSEMLKVSDGEFYARLIEMRLRLVENKQLLYFSLCCGLF